MENKEIACQCGAMAYLEKKTIEMPTKSMMLYEIKCPKCHQKVMATRKDLALGIWNK